MYVMYGLALTKRWEARLVVAELKMLQVSARMTRMYGIRNGYIRGTGQLGLFGDRQVREAKIKWFGYVHRRDSGCWVLNIELPGRRKRGKPHRIFMDVMKEDMQMVVRQWRMLG